MQTKTKLLSLALALVFACSACAGAPAEIRQSDPETPIRATALASPVSTENPYTDVPAGTWYTDAVLWCRENSVMSGTSDTVFSPDTTMTRAMLATVFYRAAGSPDVTEPSSFQDVPDGQWYSDAISWASDNGYVTGYSEDTFGTEDPVTREQTVTILWRYSGSPEATADDFTDETSISSFAATAVDWARSNSVVDGVDGGRFDPQGNLTRAQAAVILQRYLNQPSEETPAEPNPNPDTDTGSGSAPEQSSGSTVYFTSDISAAGMMAAYEALNWTPTGNVAVKLSTGEPPASNYLRPELIKDVVEEVDGTIVECNTAYGGSRSETAMHMQVAKDHGFTDIADVDILDADGSVQIPVEGGSHLETDYVGSHFTNYDSYVVLSHFKGHAMAGFGGAIKNISIGLGSQEGKCLIHTGGQSHTSPWGGDQTAFTESMAEAGKGVSDYLGNGERIIYISVLNNISIDCDCDGNPAEPDIHDIGILASTDPVAIDQAAIDLCFAAEGSESLQQRVESRNGLHTLEHAEEIGLGSRTYELVSID